MNPADIVLIVLLLLAVGFAIWRIVKKKSACSCAGGCDGSCDRCAGCEKKKTPSARD